MGLSGGLKAWQRLLKPGGVMVVSDNLWLRRSESAEVRAFWQEESPEMLDLEGTEARIGRRGYGILDHFSMPVEINNTGVRRVALQVVNVGRDDPAAPAATETLKHMVYEHGTGDTRQWQSLQLNGLQGVYRR